jgi:hypothetical protein
LQNDPDQPLLGASDPFGIRQRRRETLLALSIRLVASRAEICVKHLAFLDEAELLVVSSILGAVGSSAPVFRAT